MSFELDIFEFDDLYKQNSIYATIIFRIVRHLGIFTPNHFSSLCDQTQFWYIHFDNSTLK